MTGSLAAANSLWWAASPICDAGTNIQPVPLPPGAVCVCVCAFWTRTRMFEVPRSISAGISIRPSVFSPLCSRREASPDRRVLSACDKRPNYRPPTRRVQRERETASTVHFLSALFKVFSWSLVVFASELKSNRFSGKSAVVERGKGESVESPDVLEMVTDFLAGLRSTLPTNRRKFIHWRHIWQTDQLRLRSAVTAHLPSGYTTVLAPLHCPALFFF